MYSTVPWRNFKDWCLECASQMARYQEVPLSHRATSVQESNELVRTEEWTRRLGEYMSTRRKSPSSMRRCQVRLFSDSKANRSVPHLSDLKNACAEPISIYRTCLDKNASLSNETISEVCGEPLKALWECTERTMGEIERNTGSVSISTSTSSENDGSKEGSSRLV